MLNCLNDVVSGRALSGLTSAVLVLSAGYAQAQTDIFLINHSFESPGITDPGVNAAPEEGVLPFFSFDPTAPQWQETGELGNEQGFTGLLDAGVFYNQQYLFTLGSFSQSIPAVPNADGNQLAYLRYNSTANNGGTPTTISQVTGEAYEPFTRYTFTALLGQGTLQPPASTDPVLNPYTAILSIGYYNDDATVGSGFVSLASETINIDQMNGDGSLKDFSVILDTDDAIFAKNLVVHIQQDGGTTGSINVDNARLTKSVVPEPTSLALLGLGGLLAARRRR